MSDPTALSGWALVKRFGPLALIVGLAVAAYASGLVHELNLAELGRRRMQLAALVRQYPVLSDLVYIGVFAACVALCLPVALLLSLAGGLLFGALEGGLSAGAASVLGGLLIFMISRSAVGDSLRRVAGPRMARWHEDARRDGLRLMLAVRLIPMAPFWLVNIGAACLNISLRDFLIGSAIGILPSSFIYASLGSGLGQLFAAGARPSARLMMQPRVIAPLAALALLALAPMSYRIYRRRRAGA